MSRDRVSRRVFLKTAGAVAAIGALPTVGRAQAKEVKLGYILPVTGPLAFEAQLSLNGLQLAVDEINAAGGVKSLGGAKLTLLPGDTQQKVELGNSEAARLIDQGVTVLIGPFSSLVAFSVRQVTEKNKTPFMLLAAVADNLTEGGLRYVFRVQPNGKAMSTVTMMNIARDGQGRQRAAQAGGHDARGRQLRHDDGQPRRGLRRPARLQRGAAHSLQPQVAGLHRRAVQGEGVQARSPGDQRLLRRLQDHRRDGVQAAHRRARAGRPRQRRLLQSQVHRRQPRADRPALRRQLLAQPADPRGPRRSSPPTRSASAPR